MGRENGVCFGGKETEDKRNPLFYLNDYSEFIKQSTVIMKNNIKKRFAIMYADITGFQLVNDFYGFIEGDRLLKEMADFLTASPRTQVCGRVFSDHFLRLALFEDSLDVEQATIEYECDMKQFLEKQRMHHPNCKLHIACGLCLIPDGIDGLVAAIDNANIARKESKSLQRTRIIWFNQAMREKISRRKALEVEIQSALRNGEFSFYLQPKVNLHTGKIIGAEALARWIKADGKVIYPDEFIPLMEQNESIVDLDFFIYRKVCEYLHDKLKRGEKTVPISVNLSRVHLCQPNIASRIHALVSSYQISPYLLEFELTETLLMDDFGVAKEIIDRLRDYGYKTSIDDYGSGFTGINVWQRMNFDVLKLDKDFMCADDVQARRNDIIILATVDICRKLQTALLCEGTETLAQCAHMRELGCDIAQGYCFSPPVPVDQFDTLLMTNNGYYQFPWAAGSDNVLAPEYFDTFEIADSRIRSVTNSILKIMPCGLVGLDEKTGKLLFISDKMLEILGETREEFIKTKEETWWDKLFPISNLKCSVDTGGRFYQEYSLICNDNKKIYVNMYGARVSTPELGAYTLCCFFDETERKEEKNKADEMQGRLNSLINTFKGGFAQVVLNDGFRVALATDGYYNLAGYTREEAMRSDNADYGTRFVLHEDLPMLNAAAQEIIDGKRNHAEFRIQKKDGSIVWLAAYVVNISQNGEETIGDIVFLDISSDRQTAIEKERLSKFYAEIYDYADCAIMQFSKDEAHKNSLHCISLNDYAIRLLGLPDKQSAASIDIIKEFTHPQDIVSCLKQISLLKKRGDSVLLDFRLILRDGTIRWVTGRLKIVAGQDDRDIYLGVLVDNSEKRKMDEIRDTLNTVMERTPGDVVILRVKGRTLHTRYLTHGLCGLFGYTRQEFEEVLGKNNGEALIYEKDRGKLLNAVYEAASKKMPMDINYRAAYKEGKVGWHNLMAEYCEEEKDGCRVYHGIITSINGMKEKENALRCSDLRFRTAVELLNADVWSYNYKLDICSLPVSEKNSNLMLNGKTQYTLKEFIKEGNIHPDFIDAYLSLYEPDSTVKIREAEVLARVKDGRYQWFRLMAKVIMGEDGEPIELIGVANNVNNSKLRQARYRELQERVKQDSLTGLYNRATIENIVREQLESIKNDGSVAALMMIDIDDFKNINDTLGHHVGDCVLQDISRALKQALPPDSVLGRLGGDEFALYINHAQYESDVYEVAKNVCDIVRTIKPLEEGKRIISVSIGIAFVKKNITFNDLYERADSAMYYAKGNGKNSFSVFSSIV